MFQFSLKKAQEMLGITNLFFTVSAQHHKNPNLKTLPSTIGPFKTLIAWDAILILAKLASKTIQQLGYGI